MTKEEALKINPSCTVSYTKGHITYEEQETHISEMNDKCTATSSRPPHITKFFKRGWNPTNVLIGSSGNIVEGIFEAPAGSFTIRGVGTKREISEEHREKLRENAKKAVEARKTRKNRE